MQITVEIPDALAGLLHLGAKADLRTLLHALVEQRVAEGGFAVVQVDENSSVGSHVAQVHLSNEQAEIPRARRDALARLRGIYGDLPLSGENAVIAARAQDRY